MRLQQLLDAGLAGNGQTALPDLEITGLAADSRQVRPGYLFVALCGSRTDGRRFIHDALSKGAVAVLADESLAGAKLDGAVLIVDAMPRRRLAQMAARWFDRQPATVVAVTGTNGKTSVAHFTRQLWQALGLRAASLGTLGLDGPGFLPVPGLTTPDPMVLHEQLAKIVDAGINHLALEASSHGLDQNRLDGVRLKAAAFTNLSHDHLDYHGTLATYLSAKTRLFKELLPVDGKAVLNADLPIYAPLATLCGERRIEIIDYGRQATRLRLLSVDALPHGQIARIAVDGRPWRVEVPLVGSFQIDNLLAATGLVLAADEVDPASLFEAWPAIKGVPGRLQQVGLAAMDAPVFVDFAHSPDALEHVLKALRPHARRRLMVVFGCGGDRDRAKRPQMGAIAGARADKVFITDDNPRSEEPASIRRAILDACPGGIDVPGRGDAIRRAVQDMHAGDVLVVAGKGHETGQTVGDRVLPFDDAAEIRAALAATDRRSCEPLLNGNGM